MKPIIQIVKPDKSLNSTDIRDYLLHSRYSMLKYHSDTIHSMTMNAGEKGKTITIPHGLSYTPKFFVYTDSGGSIYMLPYRLATMSGTDNHFYTYADNTNVYITAKFATPLGETNYPMDSFFADFTNGSVGVVAGDPGIGGQSSAWRFPGIYINRGQQILSAIFEIRHVVTGTGTSDTLFRLAGVAQDNCGDITTGLPPTNALSDGRHPRMQDFFNFEHNCTAQLREITSRAGWVSGNKVGILMYDRQSPQNSYIGFSGDTTAVLKVLLPSTHTYKFRLLISKDRII